MLNHITHSKTKKQNTPIIELIDVQKYYQNGNDTIYALDQVNLSIKKGEFVVIFGPSGSGKTTLLNQIGGIDKPSKGKVIIAGSDITIFTDKRLTEYRGRVIGWIFQFFNLIPSLTSVENVAIGLELAMDYIGMEERSKKILKKLGLEQYYNSFPSQLSGGQQQRVALGRALVKNPSIVVADEPTGNLDRKTGLEVVSIMKTMNKELNATFIVVSHDQSIISVADRVLYIQDGKIIKEEFPNGVN